MDLTALQAHGEGLGAVGVSEYRGAATATRFGDLHTEFVALREGCGVYDLGFWVKISLTGGDRVRWLNGMVTNNIRDLAEGHGVYAFLLNPQGRILGDIYAYNRVDSITVDTDCGQVEKILATFDHFIIMDDVEVKDLTAEITGVGIGGPKSHDVLTAAGFTVGPMQALQTQTVSWQGIDYTIVRDEDERKLGYEIWVSPDDVRAVWDALREAGAIAVGSEALELHRVVSGIPRYGVDIRERDLPQETEQARALNFNKGCYVGQEIVERIRSRGAVHRKFSGFLIEGSPQIASGTKIVAAEKEVGEITSVASVRIAGQDKTILLGYIRREVGTPGREVMIGAEKAIVIQTPVVDAVLSRSGSALEQRPA